MSQKQYDICIIGGGASGLAAAISALDCNPQLKLAVLEKEDIPARKIYATGNGRCNFLNRYCSASDLHSCEGGDSISSLVSNVIKTYPPEKMTEFFEDLGISAAEEEDGRLYPMSFEAKSVAAALREGAVRRGAEIITGFEVVNIDVVPDYTVRSRDASVHCRKLIIASGGKAGPQFGSSGDSYKFARILDLNLIKSVPALVKFNCAEDISAAAGVRAKAKVAIVSEIQGAKSILAEESGEVQFTKDGLSGICCFNLSRYYRIADGVSYQLCMDLFPEVSEESLKARILQRRANFPDADASMLLLGLLPEKLALYVCGAAGLSSSALCCDADSGCVARIASLCKELCFNIVSTGSWKDAQVSSGGIALSGFTDDLESRIYHGLYVCGEALDVDGPCGGYNLTWAFASGRMAGASAAK